METRSIVFWGEFTKFWSHVFYGMVISFRDDFYNAFDDRYRVARVKFIEQKGYIRGQLDSAE